MRTKEQGRETRDLFADSNVFYLYTCVSGGSQETCINKREKRNTEHPETFCIAKIIPILIEK